MLGITPEDVQKYRPGLYLVRRKRMQEYIKTCQQSADARLKLRNSINTIQELLEASLRDGVNYAERVSLTLQIGYWAILWGKADAWRRFLNDAHQAIIAQKDPAQMTQYHRLMSLIYSVEGLPDQALEHGRKAYEFSLKTPPDDIFARKTGLSRYAHTRIHKEENINDLLALLQAFWDSLKQGDEPVPTNHIIMIVTLIIDIERRLGNKTRIIELVNSLIVDPDDPEIDADNKASWYHQAGLQACWIEEDYAKGNDYFPLALSFAQEHGDKSAEVGILCDWGLNLMQMGDLVMAQDHIVASYQMAKLHSPNYQLTILNGNVGLIYALRGYLDEAQDYLYDQLTMANSNNIPHERHRASANLAYIYFEMKNYALAQTELGKAVAYRRQFSNKSYAHALVLLCFADYFCHDDEALQTNLQILEDWLARPTNVSPRMTILAESVRAYCASRTEGNTKALEHVANALKQASDNPFLMGTLYLDVCRFSTGEARHVAWAKASDYLTQAGSEAWLQRGDVDNPPFILPT